MLGVAPRRHVIDKHDHTQTHTNDIKFIPNYQSKPSGTTRILYAPTHLNIAHLLANIMPNKQQAHLEEIIQRLQDQRQELAHTIAQLDATKHKA